MPGSVNGPGSVMVVTRAPGARGSGSRTKLCAAVLNDANTLASATGRRCESRVILVDVREVLEFHQPWMP